MSKLKAGIIGAGQIAETVHIANYQKYPEEPESAFLLVASS